MLISEVHVVIGGQINVCNHSCDWETMVMLMIHDVADCYEQGSFCLLTVDSLLRVRVFEGFCGSPQPPKSNSQDRKLLKRVLKNCNKDAEVYSSFTVSGRLCVGAT